LKSELTSLLLLLTILFHGAQAQESDLANSEEEKNIFSLALAYTFIPAATTQDNIQEGHFVPGIGLDYFRRINPQFELGIMADIELGSYLIPRNNDLIRDKALVIALVGSYAFSESWAIFLGPGFELERHHSFPIFRLGTEYLFTLPNAHFIPLGIFYDAKEGYDAWSICLGYGIRF